MHSSSKCQGITMKRKDFNTKRKIISLQEGALRCEELIRLASRAMYGGNPEHKRNPGDFGLTPPSSPRQHKTLCDEVGIFKRKEAQQLLQRGLRRGMVSKQQRGGWPQNIWVLVNNDTALEAQLENSIMGVYHGYPLASNDPFREVILERWRIGGD